MAQQTRSALETGSLTVIADRGYFNGEEIVDCENAGTQGEIKQWIVDTYGDTLPGVEEEPPFYVRAEIIVDPDPDEVVETAIARNTATPVKSISQAGARGHLDDLEASIKKRRPNLTIRKSETEFDGFDTRKILQYARLLMPTSVSQNDAAAEKLRAYKNPE